MFSRERSRGRLWCYHGPGNLAGERPTGGVSAMPRVCKERSSFAFIMFVAYIAGFTVHWNWNKVNEMKCVKYPWLKKLLCSAGLYPELQPGFGRVWGCRRGLTMTGAWHHATLETHPYTLDCRMKTFYLTGDNLCNGRQFVVLGFIFRTTIRKVGQKVRKSRATQIVAPREKDDNLWWGDNLWCNRVDLDLSFM